MIAKCVVAGVVVRWVRCSCRAWGWMVVYPSRCGVGCKKGRRCRSFGGWLCSRDVRSGAGDSSMCHGDAHFRRGASSRRCNMVDDPMKRARGEAAEAEVDHLMIRALVEAAEAVDDHLMNRALVEAAVAGSDDRMKR